MKELSHIDTPGMWVFTTETLIFFQARHADAALANRRERYILGRDPLWAGVAHCTYGSFSLEFLVASLFSRGKEQLKEEQCHVTVVVLLIYFRHLKKTDVDSRIGWASNSSTCSGRM